MYGVRGERVERAGRWRRAGRGSRLRGDLSDLPARRAERDRWARPRGLEMRARPGIFARRPPSTARASPPTRRLRCQLPPAPPRPMRRPPIQSRSCAHRADALYRAAIECCRQHDRAAKLFGGVGARAGAQARGRAVRDVRRLARRAVRGLRGRGGARAARQGRGRGGTRRTRSGTRAASTPAVTPAATHSRSSCRASTRPSSSPPCRWSTSSRPRRCSRCATPRTPIARRVRSLADRWRRVRRVRSSRGSEAIEQARNAVRARDGGPSTRQHVAAARDPCALPVEGGAEPVLRVCARRRSRARAPSPCATSERHAHHRVPRPAHLVADRGQAVRRREDEPPPHLPLHRGRQDVHRRRA